jgi:hypothetical protein
VDDPVIEGIKQEVADEFDVPLAYLQHFLDLEANHVHQARRHGLIDEIKRLTAQAARARKGATDEA